jgi:hypothetical protein
MTWVSQQEWANILLETSVVKIMELEPGKENLACLLDDTSLYTNSSI